MDASDIKRIETFHQLTSRDPIRNEAMSVFASSALAVWNNERYTTASGTDMRPLTAWLYEGGPIRRSLSSVEPMAEVEPDVTAYAVTGKTEQGNFFAECIAFSKASEDKVVWFAHKEDGSTFGTEDLKSALTYRSVLDARQAAVGGRYATLARTQATAATATATATTVGTMNDRDTQRIATFYQLTSRNPIRNEAMSVFAPFALAVWNNERYTTASGTDMSPLTTWLYEGAPIDRSLSSIEPMADVDPDVTAYAITGKTERGALFAECIAFSKANDDKVVWFAHREDGSTFSTGDLKSALAYRSALEAQQATVGARQAAPAPAQAPAVASESVEAPGIPLDLEAFIWRLYADMHPGTVMGLHQFGIEDPEYERISGNAPRYNVPIGANTTHGRITGQLRSLPRKDDIERYFLKKEQALWDGKPINRIPDLTPAVEGLMFRKRPDPDDIPIRILPANSNATAGGGSENQMEGDSLTVEFVPTLFDGASATSAKRPCIDTLRLVRGGALGYLVVSHERRPYQTG